MTGGGYTPVFSSLFRGSLCGQWPALPVFCTLLPLADKNGVIDMSFSYLARVTGWPEELLRDGIGQLEAADPDSRGTDDDGRRLVRIRENTEWGWRIVNFVKYREKARKASFDAARIDDGRNADRMKQRRDPGMLDLTPVGPGRTVADTSPPETREDPTRPAETRADPPSNTNTNTNPSPTEKVGYIRAAAEDFDADMLGLRDVYPRRAGSQNWPGAASAIRARLREGSTWNQILDGAKRYDEFCRATNKAGSEYVMMASTFVGPSKYYLEEWQPPPTKSQSRTAANVSAAQEFLLKTDAGGNGNG